MIVTEALKNFRNACLVVAIIGGGGCASQDSVPVAPLSNRDYILGIYLPGKQWLPTANQAGEAKAALLAYLASDALPADGSQGSFAVAHRSIVASRIDGYSLQYFGGHYRWTDGHAVPDPLGEEDILINGLCKIPAMGGADVSKQLIQASDGGACFFHALYSPARKTILQFSVNGEA